MKSTKTERSGPGIVWLAVVPVLLVAFGCTSRVDSSQTGPAASITDGADSGNVFDRFLLAELTPADGFDFPFGDGNGGGSYTDFSTGVRHDGWYVATSFAEQYSLGIHPGEDWNGRGGGNTDLGQPVHAVANGRVLVARHCGKLWGNVVVIDHLFYENHEKRRIRSLYAHLLTIDVSEGEEVKRRQVVARIGQDPDKLFHAHLHLELRWDESLGPTYWPSSDGKDVAWVREHYAEPSAFIRSHRSLPVPQKEETLVVVDHASYKMRLYGEGRLKGEYDVSFGQSHGQKRLEGDNKTPKGMYFVIQKQRGNFDGPYGAYYGGHWIKINYPNKYDAAWGTREGVIGSQEAASIAQSWSKRAPTLETSRLGGGIGFHGWVEEWNNEGPRHLSWGCVVMHLDDIRKVFDHMPKGAMVVIL